MGAGPERLLHAGLAEEIRAMGHQVHIEQIEPGDDGPPAEIRTAFELNRVLAGRVRSVVENGGFPVVLAGNCNTALGTLAGLGNQECGVLWFDSHGDFNTPETTTGGFLDGMALATVTGHCWRQLAAASVPGFQPVPERNVVLLGTRDLDPLERELLADSEITTLSPAQVRTDLPHVLGELTSRTRDVYVHIDLDVLDPTEGRANALAAPDGLSVEEVRAALQRISGLFQVRAVALTAYDPSFDTDGRVCRAAFLLLRSLLAGVSAPLH
jgi:arginase